MHIKKGVTDALRGSRHYFGTMALTAPQDTYCEVAGQYYKITGTWVEPIPGANLGFTIDASGTLTYIGPDGVYFAFSGSSDLEIDKMRSLRSLMLSLSMVLSLQELKPLTISRSRNKLRT
mgnify:CR=1 FL=1